MTKSGALFTPGDNEIEQLGRLDLELGELFALAANKLIKHHSLNPDQIAAIGSHGQTIRHRPGAHFTLQIGDPNSVTELTGITTVADFRRRDMAAGGQGRTVSACVSQRAIPPHRQKPNTGQHWRHGKPNNP